MAAGVCVLTSDIPENNEVLKGSGFTFRQGDQADLERMLDLLLRNPELRRQSSALEKDRIRHEYSWREIALSIEKTYCDLLGWDMSSNRNVTSPRPPTELVQISPVPVLPGTFSTSASANPKNAQTL
jgi:hypothetical protein